MALSDTFSQPVTCAGYGFLMVAFGSIVITPSRLYKQRRPTQLRRSAAPLL